MQEAFEPASQSKQKDYNAQNQIGERGRAVQNADFLIGVLTFP